MATLDAESDSVVVRIVYDGPPAAGKTTSLLALAGRLGQGKVFTPESSQGGRTLYFDWLEYVGGRFEGRPIRCQIVSVPGQREFSVRRLKLLESADAVVFVADTSRAGANDSEAHLRDLLDRVRQNEGPTVGVVLQANKRDLPEVAPIERFQGQRDLAVIESVASKGEGIREAFVFAVRLALDRVRELSRLGKLVKTDREHDPAQRLLEQLRSISLPGSRELWPEKVSAPVLDASTSPAIPDAHVAAGWIWPPVNGRVLLLEAASQPTEPAQQLGPHEWVADTPTGWRFHSAAGSVFTDLDVARRALIRWAQLHAALAGLLSPHRCVALCEGRDGTYRLWQVVRKESTLWKRLADVLATRDTAKIAEALTQASALCSQVADRWAQAASDLPCTLETVSAVDGTFISLVPDPEHLEPPQTLDRRLRLWQQVETLVQGELGEDARRFDGILKMEHLGPSSIADSRNLTG